MRPPLSDDYLHPWRGQILTIAEISAKTGVSTARIKSCIYQGKRITGGKAEPKPPVVTIDGVPYASVGAAEERTSLTKYKIRLAMAAYGHNLTSIQIKTQ